MQASDFPPENGHGLYREVLVWRRLDDDCALCYRCLEDLETRRFAVQSVDFHCPGKVASGQDAEVTGQAAQRFVEGFLDNTTRRGEDWHQALVEAVAHYDVRMAESDGGTKKDGG